jgi:hypothetical protein
MTFATQNMLDAMREIAYVVDENGKITMVGQPGWESFARNNNGEAIADGASVVGQSLLDFIEGEEVKDAYRQYMQALKDGETELIELNCRCDSPSTRREMRVKISPIRSRGAFQGYLFQALTLNERARPPINIFDPEYVKRVVTADKNFPLIILCSYCHKVRIPPVEKGSAASWVEVEEYYRNGGSANVRISHGICPDCKKSDVDLQF